MKRFIFVLSALMIGAAISQHVNAADSDLKIGGTVDMYYMYNFNKPSQGAVRRSSNNATGTNTLNDFDPDTTGVGNPVGTTNHRAYDVYHNQLSLNLAELELSKKQGEVGMLMDLDFGYAASTNSSAGSLTDTVYNTVGQAYLTYDPSNFKGFHLKAGKSAAYMGYETYKSKDNWNYSRSLMFTYGLPGYHMGVSAGYDVMPDKLTATFHYMNGWDNMYKREASPTFGFSFNLPNLVEKLDVTLNTIFGRARPRMQVSDNGHDYQTVIDTNGTTKGIATRNAYEAVATYKYSTDTSLAADVAYGTEKRPNNQSAAVYWGVAGYAKWKAYSKATLSPRLEFFEDRDNVAINTYTGSSSIWSATLTHGYDLAPGLDFRTELRYDMANKNMFNTGGVEGNGSFFTAKRKNATTLTLAMVYSF